MTHNKRLDIEEIRRRFDLVQYIVENFGGTPKGRGRRIDITDAQLGGMTVFPQENRWWNFSESIGGNFIDIIAYRRIGAAWFREKELRDDNFRKIFSECLVEAALFTGVEAKYTRSEKADFTDEHIDYYRALPDASPEGTPDTESEAAEPYSPSAIERAGTSLDKAFDPTLIPEGIFGRLFRYFKGRNDVPQEFLFAGTLSAFCGVLGTRVSFRCKDVTITPHDYFVVLTGSGRGKSTALNPFFSFLHALEKRVLKTEAHYENLFVFPSDSTERGLLDLLREPTQTEVSEFELAKEKSDATGKNPPKPLRTAQPCGVVINDEVTSLFGEMNAQHNAKLDSVILQLWDGAERMVATSAKNTGKIFFKETALTILSASTPKKFRDRLPQSAFEDGLIARLQFVFAPDRDKPRKALLSLTGSTNEFDADENAMLNDMLSFYQFILRAPKHITITPEATQADIESVEVWNEEAKLYAESEAAAAYFNRLDMRKLRYALLFAACDAFNRSAGTITLGAEHVRQAVRVCDFFKAHTLHFIGKSEITGSNGNANPVERMMNKIESVLLEKFGGETTKRQLSRVIWGSSKTKEEAFNSLAESGRIISTKEEYRGREKITIRHCSKQLPTPDTDIAAKKTSRLKNLDLNKSSTNQTGANLDEFRRIGDPIAPNAETTKKPRNPTNLDAEEFSRDVGGIENNTGARPLSNSPDTESSQANATADTSTENDGVYPIYPIGAPGTLPILANEDDPFENEPVGHVDLVTGERKDSAVESPMPEPVAPEMLLLAALPQRFDWRIDLRKIALEQFGLEQPEADRLGRLLWEERGELLKLKGLGEFIKASDRPAGFEGLVAFKGELPCAEPMPF
jgi:hypothetical protein